MLKELKELNGKQCNKNKNTYNPKMISYKKPHRNSEAKMNNRN
jgi:hypothetical protein